MNASTTVGSDYDCILKALSRGAESESPGNGIEQINDALTNIFADYFYSLAQQVRLDLEAKNRAGQPQELLLIPLLVRIAKFKLKQEMLREAEVCAKAALEMCENLLGPDHQESCVCKYVWLQVLYHAKRFDEAQAVGRWVRSVRHRTYGRGLSYLQLVAKMHYCLLQQCANRFATGILLKPHDCTHFLLYCSTRSKDRNFIVFRYHFASVSVR